MGPQFATVQFKGEVYELDGTMVNTVHMELSWAVKDAYALGIMFGAEDGENVWYVAIELFLEASKVENAGKYVGDGDVKVRFVGGQCWLAFKAEVDCVMVKAPSSRIIPFLLEVGRLRQDNAETIAALVEHELNTLLEVA